LLVAECLDNEVSRREDRAPKGLKFPKFLENNRNLDKLIKYLEFLLYGDKDTSNTKVLNEYTKKAEEVASKEAYKMYISQLQYTFENITYKGDISK
jgi:hypothetical protein